MHREACRSLHETRALLDLTPRPPLLICLVFLLVLNTPDALALHTEVMPIRLDLVAARVHLRIECEFAVLNGPVRVHVCALHIPDLSLPTHG